MWARRGFGVAVCGALALGCVDEAPASLQEPEHALTLLHTSDVHSRLWPFRTRISSFEAELGLGPEGALREVGGAARLAARLEMERVGRDSVWLDSGDLLEGSGVFRRYGGRVELALASGLGLAALSLGNHELSLSGAELAALLRDFAQFPVLSANLQPAAGSPLRGLLIDSAVVAAPGRRLGVIGVANATSPPNVRTADNPWGLVSVELAAAVQTAVDEMTPRAELIVLLSHLGLEGDKELLRATSGIDLVLGGHQHIVTVTPEWQDDCLGTARRRGCSSRAVPIVHSGAYGKLVSRLELTLAPEALAPERFDISELCVQQLSMAENAPENAAVSQWLEAFEADAEAPLAFLPEPLWRRSALAGDSVLGNRVTDVVLQAANADVALLNSSGLRADLEQGLLLRSDVELALPFEEPWLVALLSGSQLRHGLERAARRSSARGCESALQVAGLRLEVRCSACKSGAAGCLHVKRPTAFGALELADDELLLVALPAYLTLPSADFESAAGAVSQPLATPLSESLARHFAELPPSDVSGAGDACERELRGLSVNRCREAFGAPACPLSPARAFEVCRGLPQVRGERDGRIAVLP
jgi:5'-nucleotidase